MFAASGLALLGVWLIARRRDRPASQALRQNEERFRHLTALSADWFWETDAEHRLTWLSGGPAMAALFSAGPAYGKRLWDVPGLQVSPRRLAEHLERLVHVETQLPLFDFEVSGTDADGTQCVHEVLGRARHDAAGRFLGYRGVGRDVTAKRRAERALAEAKERFELATEGGNLAVWDCDIATDQMFLSEGWARMLGSAPLAQTVPSANLLEVVHPEDRAAARDAYLSTIKGTTPIYHVEYRVRTGARDWRWVLSTGRVTQRDASGRALRMSGTVADIDARKRAEQATRDAEERYRSLIELAPDGVTVFSNGIIEYANPAAARILKAGSGKQLVGIRVEQTIHPDDLSGYHDRMRYLSAGPGATGFVERKLRCLDGSEVVVEAASVSYLERGRLVMQSVLRDVSEQRKVREALAEREKRFRDVVEASGEYVWETDTEWRYTFLSERVEAVLGYMRHEMLGRTPRDFMPLGEARAVDAWFERHAAGRTAFHGLEHRSITKSGRVVWQQVSGVQVLDAGGRLTGYRGTGADITARKQAEERIQYLATRDALTGLPSRALLADRANQAILAAARGKGGLAVLCLRLDRFKRVNESLGHAAGDALLHAVAERLAATLRCDDTLARIGGGEFGLLWNGVKDSQDAAALAQRALATLAAPFTIEGHTLNVTASIGIGVYPEDGSNFGDLLRKATAATRRPRPTLVRGEPRDSSG